MRWIRVYLDQALLDQVKIEISGQAARHLIQVLRLRVGDRFSAFNGDGFDYPCVITQARKQWLEASIDGLPCARHKPQVMCTLGQALIKGDRMDWVIQKSVELGISCIVPLISERTEIRLKDDRLTKRMQHWRGVISSACEQCGRADIPELYEPIAWHQWAMQVQDKHKLTLIPGAQSSFGQLELTKGSVSFAIGPEGGWSDAEEGGWQEQGFKGVSLGSLILRAETAAVAVGSLIMLSGR